MRLSKPDRHYRSFAAQWLAYAHPYRRFTAALASARARLGGALAQWWVRNWNAVRTGVDLIEAFAPGAVVLAEQMKPRLFGLAPGHFRDPTPGV